jgi:cell division protein FtsL
MRAAVLAQQQIVRPARSRRRPAVAMLGLAFVVWLAAVLALGAWVRLQTIQAGYDISEQRRERARLLEANRKLELELARLSSLDRIEAVACGKLGMKFPTQSQMVTLP